MLEQDIEDLRVELGLPSSFEQPDRFVDAHGRPVTAIAEQGVEDVGDRGDPTLQRDLLAAQALWIAPAVVALVMGEAIVAATRRSSLSDSERIS